MGITETVVNQVLTQHVLISHHLTDPLNAELNPIYHLPAFATAPYIYDISRLRVNIESTLKREPSKHTTMK
jgi:hypothetical protein